MSDSERINQLVASEKSRRQFLDAIAEADSKRSKERVCLGDIRNGHFNRPQPGLANITRLSVDQWWDLLHYCYAMHVPFESLNHRWVDGDLVEVATSVVDAWQDNDQWFEANLAKFEAGLCTSEDLRYSLLSAIEPVLNTQLGDPRAPSFKSWGYECGGAAHIVFGDTNVLDRDLRRLIDELEGDKSATANQMRALCEFLLSFKD